MQSSSLNRIQLMEASMITESGRGSVALAGQIRRRDDSDASMAQQTTSTLIQPTKPSSPMSPSSKPAPSKRQKRIKRKCSHPLCQNHVVQGGVCVTHGARRRMCAYPGCIKAVKLAGYCSGHGPTRIVRCNQTGCSRVAVIGGRCLSHGTIQRICNYPMTHGGSCVKPAFIGGLCKNHHDRISYSRGAHDPVVLCTPATPLGLAANQLEVQQFQQQWQESQHESLVPRIHNPCNYGLAGHQVFEPQQVQKQSQELQHPSLLVEAKLPRIQDPYNEVEFVAGASPKVAFQQHSKFQRAGEAMVDLETFVRRQELEAVRQFQQQHMARHSSEGSSRSNNGFSFIPPALPPPARFVAGGGWVWAPPTGALSASYQWPSVTTFQPRIASSAKELDNAGMNTSSIDRSNNALPIKSSSDGDDGTELLKQRKSQQIPLFSPSLSNINRSCNDSQGSITSEIIQRSKDSKIEGPLYSGLLYSESAHRGISSLGQNEGVDTSVSLRPIQEDEILQESVLLLDSLRGNESLHSIDDGEMLAEEKILNRSTIFVPKNHTDAEYQIDSSPSSNYVLPAASQMWPGIYNSPSVSRTYSSSDNSCTSKDSKHVVADMLSKVNQFEESDNADTNERGDSDFSGLSLL